MSTEENHKSPFEAFGLNSKLLKTVAELGYESPSPIQSESIPPLLDGRDILGQAQTGSGKTFTMAGVEEKLGKEGYIADETEGIIPRGV